MRVGYIGTNHFIVVGFHFHFCLSARVSDYGPVKDTGNKKYYLFVYSMLQYIFTHAEVGSAKVYIRSLKK